MAENGENEEAKLIGDSKLPIGGLVRVGRLDDMRRVRSELGRLYREARRRHGRYPDAQTALRLANILGSLRTLIEVEELSARLVMVEEEIRNAK